MAKEKFSIKSIQRMAYQFYISKLNNVEKNNTEQRDNLLNNDKFLDFIKRDAIEATLKAIDIRAAISECPEILDNLVPIKNFSDKQSLTPREMISYSIAEIALKGINELERAAEFKRDF